MAFLIVSISERSWPSLNTEQKYLLFCLRGKSLFVRARACRRTEAHVPIVMRAGSDFFAAVVTEE